MKITDKILENITTRTTQIFTIFACHQCTRILFAQYFSLDALPRATTVYIGSDSVFIEDKTIYYCPDEPNVLIFQCHVHNSNIMEWRVSNNTANNTIRFAASADVEKIARDGYISAFLNNEVQNNPDHSKNNFTSIMYLDTKDLVGHNITTVSCRTSDSKHFDKHYLIPLGKYACTFMYVGVYMYMYLYCWIYWRE